MSRSKNDPKHGKTPHGEGTKQRACGYEYWTSRGGQKHGEPPGKDTKKKTHKRERRF